jgi:hypothetical protein
MAKVLYKHFAGEVKLDKHAFYYGNIKPDLPSLNRNHHTIDNCLITVCDKANQLMEEDVPIEVLSEILGEICHYVCDFCCYYHLDEELHSKILQHFAYELKLHWKLFKEKYKLTSSRMQPRKDINSIVIEMRKAYLDTPQSMQRDIDFAFASAVWTCESIIYFNKNSIEIANEAEAALYSFMIKEGGRL